MRPFVENEDFELISNYDLVQSAHALTGRHRLRCR